MIWQFGIQWCWAIFIAKTTIGWYDFVRTETGWNLFIGPIGFFWRHSL